MIDEQSKRAILNDLRKYLILKSPVDVSKDGDSWVWIGGRQSICLESNWIVMYFRDLVRIPIASIADPRYREKTLNVVDTQYGRTINERQDKNNIK